MRWILPVIVILALTWIIFGNIFKEVKDEIQHREESRIIYPMGYTAQDFKEKK